MNGPRLGVGSEKVGGGVMKRIDVECSSEHVTAPRFSCSQSVHDCDGLDAEAVREWLFCGSNPKNGTLRNGFAKKAQAFAIANLPFAFYGLDGALVADGRR